MYPERALESSGFQSLDTPSIPSDSAPKGSPRITPEGRWSPLPLALPMGSFQKDLTFHQPYVGRFGTQFMLDLCLNAQESQEEPTALPKGPRGTPSDPLGPLRAPKDRIEPQKIELKPMRPPRSTPSTLHRFAKATLAWKPQP
jgi:hypothetical protein